MELERSNQSRWNDSMIIEHAKKLFTKRIGKKFDLDHWYDMLKDQPKWKTPHTPTINVSQDRQKGRTLKPKKVIMKLWRLLKHPRRGERPEGRKTAKRRLKEKGNKHH